MLGDAGYASLEGAVLFYEWSPAGWVYHSMFRAPGGEMFDLLGGSVDIEGTTVVAGAQDYGSPGEVWILDGGGGDWIPIDTLSSPNLQSTGMPTVRKRAGRPTLIVIDSCEQPCPRALPFSSPQSKTF